MTQILLVAHVGETFGHVADALSIGRALVTRGLSVGIAASEPARDFVRQSGVQLAFYPVRWNWSHNSSGLNGLSSQFLAEVVATCNDLMGVFEQTEPDLVLGLPGFASTPVARRCGVPHASVLHGIHLAPLINLRLFTTVESAVLAFARRVCLGPLNEALEVVSRKLGGPHLNYHSYIESEKIFLPQPSVPFESQPNIHVTNFVRGSLGRAFDGDPDQRQGACYITFGSGNRCDISRVIHAAREVFDKVVLSAGDLKLGPLPLNTVVRRTIASWSLAGRVAAVVSHGGVGTVGTFCESGTPQLIIPTEITQATMAVFAAQAGIATNLGLESFATRSKLGRQLPELTDHELRIALNQLRHQPAARRPPSSGAEEIAEQLATHVFAPV